MSRYIDADKLIDDLEHDIAIDQDQILYVGTDMREKESIQFDKDCKQNCIDMLLKAPTADVRKNIKAQKVLAGGVLDGTTHWYECSYCHGAVDILDAYCKHCGAVLELEDEL